LRHQVLSISNETQDQLHRSQVTIYNAVEPIQKEMLAWILIPHLRTANDSSHLTGLDTEDEKVLEEEGVTGEKEEEEGGEGNEEGSEEDEPLLTITWSTV